MLFRDLGVPHAEAAAACGIDQRPGLVAGRVLEGRAAGAAAERLRFLAGAGDGVHLRADRLKVAGRAPEHGFDDDRALRHFAVAIGVTEPVEWPFDDLAGAK